VGISAQTPTPRGGQIVRKSGSQEPAGLVMETAFFAAAAKFPQPSAEQKLEALRAAQLHYAANGYTTIQDGLTDAAGLAILQRAAAEKRLFLDVVALLDSRTFAVNVGKPGIAFGPYQGHLKLGGVKSIVDGSAQARTAFFSEPMKVPGPNGQRGWRGEPISRRPSSMPRSGLAYQNNVQTYSPRRTATPAIDMVLAAHEAAGAPQGRRPVIIHSQFVRPEQLNSYARIGRGAVVLHQPRVLLGRRPREEPRRGARFVPLAAALGDRARACTSPTTATTR
jgi:predicted amidohydrolase YtcJ